MSSFSMKRVSTGRPPGTFGQLTALGSLILCILSAAFGIAWRDGVPPPWDSAVSSLASVLDKTITAQGIEAASLQYRAFQGENFQNVAEGEAAINALGYRLLARGDTAAAVQIFRLNAQTHPRSANAYDSLAEAYVAAGDKAAAVFAYQAALTVDPDFKVSARALATLTGTPRKPLRPLILFHILAGTLGIVSGFGALVFTKGGRLHRLSGNFFFGSMLVMSGLGGYLSIGKSQTGNLLAAAFTCYLIVTAWVAARHHDRSTRLVDWIGLVAASGIAMSGIALGIEAAHDEVFLAPYIGFGAFAILAATMDLRVILLRGLDRPARIVRHLWRMSAALFIATTSFFVGQSQVFPAVIRDTGLFVLPTAVVLLVLLYWLVRVLYWDRCRGVSGARLPSV